MRFESERFSGDPGPRTIIMERRADSLASECRTGQLRGGIIAHPLCRRFPTTRSTAERVAIAAVFNARFRTTARNAMFTDFVTKCRLVVSRAFDETQAANERRVVGLLVVHRQPPEECKCRALRELFYELHFVTLARYVRRPVEQAKAHGVADAPVVEAHDTSGPSVRTHALRVVDERRGPCAPRTDRYPRGLWRRGLGPISPEAFSDSTS